METPISDDARLILKFIKAHPGVQAKYIVAGTHLGGQEFAKAFWMLQRRQLIEGRADASDVFSPSMYGATRYFAKT